MSKLKLKCTTCGSALKTKQELSRAEVKDNYGTKILICDPCTIKWDEENLPTGNSQNLGCFLEE